MDRFGAYRWQLDDLEMSPWPKDFDEHGIQWIAHKVEGWWGRPSTGANYNPKVVRAGAYRSPSFEQERTISLTGRAFAPDWSILEEWAYARVSAICSDHSTPYLLTCFSSLGELSARVHLDDELLVYPIEQKSPAIEFSAQLVAPDPRKYLPPREPVSTDLGTPAPGGVLWNGTDGASGTEWNGPDGTTGLVYQTGPGTVGLITLENGGTDWTEPVFTITGPVAAPVIIEVSSGRRIAYSGALSSGQELTLDVAAGSARTLDGIWQNPRLDQADWDAFAIPPKGKREFLFRAAAPSSSALLTGVSSDAFK